MPFQSRQQAKFAFATKQPWAKEWASKTDFTSLPSRKSKAIGIALKRSYGKR